jgi:hypothetical protein
LNAWTISVVLSFTVLMSFSVGVIASYGLVSGILYAFRSLQPEPDEAKPVLMARNAQAGAG